ncbi:MULTISPECIES: NACHT domain-containing protein [unclassified Nostoc]|uniref:NACHT domain-containing protein n=1 Tax=unclassified Nostoc TaxID=2593658 RepID=UPI002AD563D6|nr:NACHT domain-containing protein [Nostoc sp. DedQUE03]MDZ7976621.1 NACHT domain-containing protein [Nostoc sp. DedQUE03]MDZ8049809.1 NACHT domain-containing protein [Nostoc sp. DedQUE02]
MPLTPVGNTERPKNEQILLASVKSEVTSQLRQSLHNAVLINLGKELQLQQVKRPWNAERKIGLKPAEALPESTTILSVFDSQEVAGKLLILGAPGSGKTTTQLELAQELIKRAEEQPNYPVPVSFNLSFWKDDQQPMTDWLVTELKSKYGVSIKVGKEWVDNHRLLPLLDGLDEVEPQRQELCVHEINKFLVNETRPLYLIVCSRIEEYSNYATQLQLNGAISLQSLTNHQICDYLASIKYRELWLTISSDLDLLELVKIPLLLSITVLVSQEISVGEWQHLTSTAERHQYLLDAYIGHVLAQDIHSRGYLKHRPPNARKTRMWLVWLAGQMLKESKTEFLIEEMQPSLLRSKIPKIIYNLIVWGVIQMLITGLILGIFGVILGIFGVTGEVTVLGRVINHGVNGRVTLGLLWLLQGLNGGMIIGLIVGLINGLFGEIIEDQLENIGLIKSEKSSNKTREKWLIIGIIWGIINQLISGRIIIGVIVVLIWGLLIGLINGLIGDKIEAIEIIKSFHYLLINELIISILGGANNLAIETKTIPNQGILQGVKNTFTLSVLYFLPSTILIFLIQIIQENNSLNKSALISSLMFGLFFGLLVGILRSGTPVIKHFALRLILYFNGYIPWNYARFLDYCTERMLLQRVGGRYRFIHKLLQDHFAQMEFRRD